MPPPSSRPLVAVWIVLSLVPAGAWAQREMTDMERAQRAADGPRRLVIEASRLPAKPAPAGGPERTAPKPVAVVAPPRPVLAEKAPVPPPAAAAPAAVALPPPVPVAAAASAPALASVPVAEAPAAPVPIEPAPAVSAPPPEPTVVAVVAPPPPVVPVPAQVAEPAPPAPVVELAPLRLASMVEPTVPRRLAGRLRGELAAVVRFTVRSDGTIADAEVDESSHRQMDESVLEAVRQWRYAPPGVSRDHAVRLTMKF